MWTLGRLSASSEESDLPHREFIPQGGGWRQIYFKNFVVIFLPPQFRDFHRQWKTYTTGHWKWLSFRQPARSCLIFSHPKQTHSHGIRHIIRGWSDAQHFLLLRTTSQPDIDVRRLLSPNREFISNCETLSILTNALRRMQWYNHGKEDNQITLRLQEPAAFRICSLNLVVEFYVFHPEVLVEQYRD